MPNKVYRTGPLARATVAAHVAAALFVFASGDTARAACVDPGANGQTIVCTSLLSGGLRTDPQGPGGPFDNVTFSINGGGIIAPPANIDGIRIDAGSNNTRINVNALGRITVGGRGDGIDVRGTNSNLHIATGGEIRAASNRARALRFANSSGTSIVTNLGRLLANGLNRQVISGGNGREIIVNYFGGRIDGRTSLGNGNDIFYNLWNGDVNGTGTVVNLGRGSDIFYNLSTVGDVASRTGTVHLGNDADWFANWSGASIGGDVRLGNGDDVVVQNHGTIGRDLRLDNGDDSATNTGTIGRNFRGGNDDDALVNSGTVGRNLRGDGGDDQVTNTGSVARDLKGDSGDDRLANDGTVGRDLRGDNGNDVIVNTGTVQRDLSAGNGDDQVSHSGSVGDDVLLGGGDDVLTMLPGASVGDRIDGGSGNDALNLDGTGTASLDLDQVRNFEMLAKQGAGAWTLSGRASVRSLDILAGVLNVAAGARLDVTGNTTNVAAGTTMNVNGTVNEAGNTTISGTMNVNNGGTFNAGNDAGDTTMLNTAGRLNVFTGGTYNAAGALTNGGFTTISGGTLNALGPVTNDRNMFATAGGSFDVLGQTVNNGVLATINPGSSYTARGALVNNGTLVPIFGGSFTARSTTTNNNLLWVFGAGSSYVAEGSLLNQQTVNVTNGGTLTAQSSTTNNGTVLISGAGSTFNAQGALTSNGLTRVIGGGVLDAQGGVTIAGGTLEGNSRIQGPATVVNTGGTVRPGVGPGNIAALAVIGSYAQGPGGSLVVDVSPGGTADLLSISGVAALDGALVVNALAGQYSAGQVFTVLTAGGGVTGTFATVNGAIPGFLSHVQYNPNDVTILLALTPAALARQPGLNPNQRNILRDLSRNVGAGAIGGDLGSLAVQLGLMPGAADVGAAIDQLSPEVFDAYATGNLALMQQFSRAVNGRAQMLRQAAFLAAGTPRASRNEPRLLADAGGVSGIVTSQGRLPVLEPGQINLWASTIGGYAHVQRTSSHLGYGATSFGGMFGGDVAVNERLVIGLLVGTDRTDINFSGAAGDGRSESLSGGVYAAWLGERLFANGSVTYGHNWQKSERSIVFGTFNRNARAKSAGNQFSAQAQVGRTWRLERVVLEPSAGLEYVRLHQNGFVETGAGALSLAVRDQTRHSLRARLEMRAAFTTNLSETLTLVPEVRFGYARELLDFDRSIDASFAGVTSQFTVQGRQPDRNVALFGAGLSFNFRWGLSLFAEYRGEISRTRQFHGGSAGLRVSW